MLGFDYTRNLSTERHAKSCLVNRDFSQRKGGEGTNDPRNI